MITTDDPGVFEGAHPTLAGGAEIPPRFASSTLVIRLGQQIPQNAAVDRLSLIRRIR